MTFLMIGATRPIAGQVRDWLQQEFADYGEEEAGFYTRFRFPVEKSAVSTIAESMARLITTRLQNYWLERFLHIEYDYFDQEEQENIVNQTCQYLEDSLEDRQRSFSRMIQEYLANHREFVIDGFVRFRLKHYWQLLRDALDVSVESFLVEREYREFIRLLRYFVELQEPKVGMVNVLVSNKGEFTLIDQFGGVISTDYLDNFILELDQVDLDYEDLLISALITVAPQQVVMHNLADHHLTKTIVSIFQDRVRVCEKCSLCYSTEQESKGTYRK